MKKKFIKKRLHKQKRLLIRVAFFACYMFCLGSVYAQLNDSIVASLSVKPKLSVYLETKNSFIRSSFAKVKGIKAGVNFEKRFLFMAGYHWLDGKDFKYLINADTVAIRLNYGSVSGEYAYFSNRQFEFTIYAQLGLGVSRSRPFRNKEFIDNGINKNFLMVYEPGSSFQVRILKYIGVGLGMGYRLVLIGNKKQGQSLNSPTYQLKTKVFLEDVWKAIFKSK